MLIKFTLMGDNTKMDHM